MAESEKSKRPHPFAGGFLAMVLAGTVVVPDAHADGCFRFRNAGFYEMHVSFKTDPAACPTGTCWQSDVPGGETAEYCPQRFVYPPGVLGWNDRDFTIVFDETVQTGRHSTEVKQRFVNGRLNVDARNYVCEMSAGGRFVFKNGCGPVGIVDYHR